jgi:hypothetical protein
VRRRIAAWFRTITGEEVRAAKLRVEAANGYATAAAERRKAREVHAQLKGPIHGKVQWIRGMCSDSLAHEEIDAKLAELDDVVHAAAEIVAPTAMEVMAENLAAATRLTGAYEYVPPGETMV